MLQWVRNAMAIKNVIFKGRQYATEDITPEASQLMGLLQAANDEITRAQARIALLETSRQVISEKLEGALASVPSQDVAS